MSSSGPYLTRLQNRVRLDLSQTWFWPKRAELPVKITGLFSDQSECSLSCVRFGSVLWLLLPDRGHCGAQPVVTFCLSQRDQDDNYDDLSALHLVLQGRPPHLQGLYPSNPVSFRSWSGSVSGQPGISQSECSFFLCSTLDSETQTVERQEVMSSTFSMRRSQH